MELSTNQPVELTAELSQEEKDNYEQQAKELAAKYNVPKVHVYVGFKPSTKERVVGFIKEPSFIQKVMMMDKITTAGMFIAGNELRESCTLKEESDPLTTGSSWECDEYKLGLNGFCTTILQVVQNEFKKK